MPIGYTPMSFEKARELIENEQIVKLYRSPDCMMKYREMKSEFKNSGINMTTRILVCQLHWVPEDTDLHIPFEELFPLIKPKDKRPFACSEDMTILFNLFPYYFPPGVVHLCIWVKFSMEPDPKSAKGDISDHQKHLVDLYVKATFVDHLGLEPSQVTWFKNWRALQSIKSLPHIHVILDHPDPEKLHNLIGTGGVPINYDDTKL